LVLMKVMIGLDWVKRVLNLVSTMIDGKKPYQVIQADFCRSQQTCILENYLNYERVFYTSGYSF
jgi:hypothetical protein